MQVSGMRGDDQRDALPPDYKCQGWGHEGIECLWLVGWTVGTRTQRGEGLDWMCWVGTN